MIIRDRLGRFVKGTGGFPYNHKEESKNKISKSLIGNQNGKGNSGNKLTKEHRKNISKEMSGNKHWNWQDGKSFEIYPKEFKLIRPLIRQRDNFTCQECNFTEKQLLRKLDVHHIDYNKQNNIPENLISLCKSCHTQTGFNRNDWIKYFENKIGELNKNGE